MGDVVKRRPNGSDGLWKLPPSKFGTKSRERKNWPVAAAKKDNFASKRKMEEVLACSSSEPLLCDTQCSKRYKRSSSDGIAWTLTASRAAAGGPWIVREARHTDDEEMSWMQGVDFVHDGVRDALRRLRLKKSTYGHMLGNATALSVTERVLRNVLVSIGYIKDSHEDRWADPTGDARPLGAHAQQQ